MDDKMRAGALSMVWIDGLFPATSGPKRSTMLLGTETLIPKP